MPPPRSSLLPFLFLQLLPPQLFFLVCSDDLKFSFSSFLPTEPYLDIASAGAIQGSALQLTFDTGSQSTKTADSTGRITYTEQLRLWDPRYSYSASFNTSFVLNMEPLTPTGGDNSGSTSTGTGGGMAFVLSSHTASESLVANSYGEWLGLFNGNIVAAPDSVHQLVAVEFDTFKDSFDPDDNHVGIDLNSTVSVTNSSLDSSGVILRTDTTNTSVWVDYDGRGKQVNVFVKSGTTVSKPFTPVLSYAIDLSLHLPENIYFGFSGSTGSQIETHCVLEWNFTTSEGLPDLSPNIGLIVGMTVAAFVVLLVLAVAIVARWRRAKPLSQAWLNLTYGPRKFTYRELSKATNNFSGDCLLGQGGFGAVYKGTLADPANSAVAVKRISPKSRQGEREFVAEVTIIGRLRHKNLVQLLGWCQERKGKLLLVYEYMPNGSLDQWLHGGKDGELGWKKRFNVMKGLAAGLLYLHEEWEMVVVHRDLKPSNVMLDGEYNARLGDFGLARLIEGGEEGAETRNIAGTPGYIAPECLDTGVVNKESDLYSFGAVAMEVASGCRPSAELRHWLSHLHHQNRLFEAADPHLASFDPAEMERLLLVGLACCHPEPTSRPSIRQVLHALSSSSFPLIVPPSPRSFSFPRRPPLANPIFFECSRSLSYAAAAAEAFTIPQTR